VDIAFVLTCKGRLHHLKETLPLIVRQEPDEIIVVDYGCPDGTAAWVAVNFPRVKIVQFDSQSFNISHARNLGAKAVQSVWLCFIDADIKIASGWLEWLRHNMRPKAFYRSDTFINGTTGTMVCLRSDFESVGGYDEVFTTYGGGRWRYVSPPKTGWCGPKVFSGFFCVCD
jgi:glycosyltransferase involved in cell wall biosynthesis